MTHSSTIRTRSLRLRLYASVCVGVLALSLVFVESLAMYWARFRLGTAGGNGMALTFVVLPGAVAVGIVLGTLIARGAVRRGASSQVALGRAFLAVVLFFVALILLEVLRTRELRHSQDEGANRATEQRAPTV